MFSINCLEITASKNQWEGNKSLYKNLLSDKDYVDFEKDNVNHEPFRKRFFFNDFYKKKQHGDLETNTNRALPENFFGDKINVQAIVGKNGSGKSSLMDLMYMAINNFSYMFERGHDRPGADPLYYIPGLYVNIYFSYIYTPTHTEIYNLQCIGDVVKFHNDNANDNNTDNESKKINYTFSLDDVKYFNEDEIPKLVENFFYSIVSNYSLQSFIHSNYKRKVILSEKSEHSISNKEVEASWINSIFHKNDSYIRSIVLNPFRGNGKINLENELELSKDRLTALLLWYKQEKISRYKNTRIPFFPYEYESFSFCYKDGFIREKIKNHFKLNKKYDDFDKNIDNDLKVENFIDKLLSNNASFLSLFLDEFFIEKKNLSSIHKMACAYIIAKILSIVHKYPSYLNYRNIYSFDFSEAGELTLVNHQENLFIELFDLLKKDTSHITKKLRRAINFLRTTINVNSTQNISDRDYFTNLYQWYVNDYPNYFAKHLSDKHTKWFKYLSPFNHAKAISDKLPPFIYPAKIDESLPPSFFYYELYVNNTEKGQAKIPYRNLSSGEIQMLQTLSIHTYHMENIFSIFETDAPRPKYSAVNLVFDEVEICFHPEYQRNFVIRILDLLDSLEYNHYYINVFLITHSPFILSDIPVSNVLFLEEGTQNLSKSKETRSFAQNIGEMMYDSFFMEKTIGDFAEAKLKELIKRKQGKDSKIKTDEEAKRILDLIGDPVIRSLIEEIGKEDGDVA